MSREHLCFDGDHGRPLSETKWAFGAKPEISRKLEISRSLPISSNGGLQYLLV